MLVKAIIVNRNLLTTLKATIEFLRKEVRVEEIHILDQSSTYPPLLEWYKTIPEIVHYSKNNSGPYVAWDASIDHLREGMFIVADPDCTYDNVPSDWLDVMINVLDKSGAFKIGFSLDIEDLPNTEIGIQAHTHESKYWEKENEYGWEAHVDTTFALYKPHSVFSYDAIRLDKPYCIKHTPWYLDVTSIPEEWQYYLDHASGISTWGNKLKQM